MVHIPAIISASVLNFLAVGIESFVPRAAAADFGFGLFPFLKYIPA